MASVLEVENLRTEFHLRSANVRAVDGVTFSVEQGECVGLVGESGCGKSTTGLSIMKLLPDVGHLTAGSVRLAGRDLAPLSEPDMRRLRGNEMAMIFQDPMTSLNPTWTIGRQLAEPVRLHRGATRSQALDRALEVLHLVGMPHPEERLDYYPHQLSGGLRQRVMIAMALACEPKLLIADEPTTALDVTIQAQILNLIDDLRERLRMAVVLITHDMGVIATRTDRVMVMYAGKIVEGAKTEELFGSVRHPYTEALLRSIPRVEQQREARLDSIPGLPPDLSRPPAGCRFHPRCRYGTAECTAEEPLLAPGPGPSPGAGAAETSRPSAVAASEVGIIHIYACYHPVSGGEGIDARPLGFPALSGEAPRQAAPADDSSTAGELEQPLSSPADLSPADLSAPGPGAARPGGVPAEPGGGPVEPAAAPVGVPVGTRSGVGAPSATAPDGIVSSSAGGLVVDHLVKDYPVTSGFLQRAVGSVKAVSDVSFALARGETFGLVGESGCGKTTIGRLVVALEQPTAGSVSFDGTDLTKLRGGELRRRRRHLQLMFQDPYASLDPRMRVGAIVREPLAIQGVGSADQQRRRVRELLGEVGLPAVAEERYPHEFSGGQRQRIGLARALALNPQLIVADEPVSALDVSIQAQILNLMRRLQESHGMSYVVISHDLAVVRYLADSIGVMYLGKLVEIGPAAAIYESAAHPYTRGLLDTVPRPDPALRHRQRAAVRGELPSALNPPSGCRFRTRCPFAQDRCAEEEPPLRLFGTGHRAACHFPLQTPLEDDHSALAKVAPS